MAKVLIDFYLGTLSAGLTGCSVGTILGDLLESGAPPCHAFGDDIYEVRRLAGNAERLRGEFAKIRQRDIPHAGAPGGTERELDLAEEEGLVEKNFFQYWLDRNLLVYQRSGTGSTSVRLAQYLSRCSSQTVAFDPVLQPEPMRRLMRGSVRARALKIRVARPTHPDMYPNDVWNQHMMRLLQGSGALSLSVEVRGDGRSADPDQRFLWNAVKDSVRELVGIDGIKKAVMEIEDLEYPGASVIDLLKDRLCSVQTVERTGRYFDATAIHAALTAAYEEKQPQLDELFGHGNQRLE